MSATVDVRVLKLTRTTTGGDANYRTMRFGGWSDEQAGHDFVLTRNRHGAGFWDRSYSPADAMYHAGRELTAASVAYGETYVYLGDDGFLHIN